MTEKRHVYGPVASRRLGFSLGVDVLPFKTCTLDCVYCQLGSTGKTTVRRGRWFPPADILAQIKEAVDSGQRIDVITFSGSGEPTLCRDLGRLIRAIKKMTRIPVAVLTNATLLARPDVRRELAAADIVVPSLDAVAPAVFRRVNRPHASLVNARIIDGLARFREEFKGDLRLEVMLVKGVNDSPAAIRALQAAVARIRPDRIELNTVVRPPAERRAMPLRPADLERIRAELGPKAEVVAAFAKKKPAPAQATEDLEGPILATVRRRPQTAEDIAAALGVPRGEVLKALSALRRGRRVQVRRHAGKVHFEARAA
ncbi:MAG TPA: radical SAM protein [Candidatus Bathyarchaeia archaeon]|nr:radical SAM protein [Candidatus Bathyarchaeia archaeon]